MTKPTLIVMAAGIGSRYGGLKQMDPFGPNGENIIDYSIYDALRAGFDKVVFVIKKDIEEIFREKVGNRIEEQCETIYVFQELNNLPVGYNVPLNRIKPWGTGHAVLSCKHVVDGAFTVINADDYYGPSAYKLSQGFLNEMQAGDVKHHYCMVGYILENTLTEHGHVARGVCQVDGDGFLLDVHERTRVEKAGNSVKYSEDEGETWIEIPKDSTVSMNFWCFQPSMFTELEEHFRFFLDDNHTKLESAEYFLPSVVNDLIKEMKAKITVLTTHEKWFGVTYQEDKIRVEQAINDLIRRGVYPKQLWRNQ
jgi:UTP-glucose-1-phosphate uridylyltransferase